MRAIHSNWGPLKQYFLRYAPENRSSPRVVTRKWQLKNYKLTTKLKNKTLTYQHITKTLKKLQTQTD
jgi:hypothetical protein